MHNCYICYICSFVLSACVYGDHNKCGGPCLDMPKIIASGITPDRVIQIKHHPTMTLQVCGPSTSKRPIRPFAWKCVYDTSAFGRQTKMSSPNRTGRTKSLKSLTIASDSSPENVFCHFSPVVSGKRAVEVVCTAAEQCTLFQRAYVFRRVSTALS